LKSGVEEMNQDAIIIEAPIDIITARQFGRDLARDLGFGLADQTRLATSISELTRNVIQYAETGTCLITDASDESTHCVQVEVLDHGPGIPDIERAMEDGFSTGSGLGAGLPGVKRLMHDFHIESRPGFTKITSRIRRIR
jgi:serine/threonine-protein kinase RsbT